MTFSLKSIAVTAAFVAAGSASAGSNWAFVSGTGSLAFSLEATWALDASGAYILTEGAGNKASYDEATGKVSLELTDGTTSGNDIKTLKSMGSSVVIQRTVMKGKTVWVNNTITLTDFVFDLGTKTLSAGILGTNLVTGVATNYGFNAIYSAAALEGTSLDFVPLLDRPFTGQASGKTKGTLSINSATADTFLTILGLPLTGGVADLVRNADWGVASFDAVMAVPEPSAYLSALAGIAILGVARLRKHKTA